MSDNFKETVNLKDRMLEMKDRKKDLSQKKQINKAKEVEKLYKREKTEKKESFEKINRPPKDKSITNPYKGLFFVLLILLSVFVLFSYFGKNDKQDNESISIEEKWYLVELKNDEVFYGKIADLKNDPIEIKNVYYNYVQASNSEEETGNLRLVKRGKETYGPDGTMMVYSSNINKMEPLSENSKVLKAILANEK